MTSVYLMAGVLGCACNGDSKQNGVSQVCMEGLISREENLVVHVLPRSLPVLPGTACMRVAKFQQRQVRAISRI